jgi:hypothetical protein
MTHRIIIITHLANPLFQNILRLWITLFIGLEAVIGDED